MPEICPLCQRTMKQTDEGFWCDTCDCGYADSAPITEAEAEAFVNLLSQKPNRRS